LLGWLGNVASILVDRSAIVAARQSMACRTGVNISQIQWVVRSCSGVMSKMLLAIVIAGSSVSGVWESGGPKMVIVGIIVMVIVIRKSSSSTTLAVDCIMGCVSWGVKAMMGGSPISVFSVVLEFVVFGIIVDIVGFGGGIRKLSSSSSTMLVGNCVSGGARRVGAVTGELPISIFLVVSVSKVISIIVGIIGIIRVVVG